MSYSGTSYYGHFETLILVLITEVSSIQRSLNTLQYYTETQNGVLIIEVSSIQSSPDTLQYYTETQNGVLIIEVSAMQRFVIREVPLYIHIIQYVHSVRPHISVLMSPVSNSPEGFFSRKFCNYCPPCLVSTLKGTPNL